MKGQFNTFHPVITFSYYIGSIAMMMMFLHPVFLMVGLSIFLVIHFFHDYFQSLKRWLFFIFFTGMLIFLLNPIFNERGRNELFEIVGHRITLEATVYGAISALSIIGVLMLFVSYNDVMTPNKLLFLFSKILPQFAILLMLTLRFIPLMRRRLEDISQVQMSKGILINHGSWRNRIKKGMLYIQVLVTYSLEEAIQTADSMKARGYGEYNRSSYEFFRMKKSDKLALIYLFLLFLLSIYGRFLGHGLLSIYPIMEPMNLQSTEIIILILNILYFSFPLFVELGETIRWRILN